jgi:transposase InsO family protein
MPILNQLSVFKHIEVFYKHQRLHQSLGYKTSEQFEAKNAPAIGA